MRRVASLLCIALFVTAPALAGPAQDQLLDIFRQQANGATFSAKAGQKLFLSENTTGKPETPSCTTCHGKFPEKPGLTRAGKVIEPMALSVTPDRFSDLKKVEKWFRRNCGTVLGRECTVQEKGDFLTFMMNQ